MAKRKTRREMLRVIRKHDTFMDGTASQELWDGSPGQALTALFLDNKYRALTEEGWHQVLAWSQIDKSKYIPDRRDCDDFAFWLKGELAGRFALNGIGLVVDAGAAHAYNALLVQDPGGPPRVAFCEPQSDAILVPGDHWPNALQNGFVIF